MKFFRTFTIFSLLFEFMSFLQTHTIIYIGTTLIPLLIVQVLFLFLVRVGGNIAGLKIR